MIVALWAVLILALLIGSFAFEMHIEAGIISYARKRMKAQYLARAGVEWAKAVLVKSSSVDDEEIAEEDEASLICSINLSHGCGINGYKRQIDAEKNNVFFTVDITPERGKRNLNKLTDRDWEELLDQSGVPEDRWPGLIDCVNDWRDKNDLSHLNGAESDDEYYSERGYKCKNADIDTVDELSLVKGFTSAIVYGGQTEDGEPLAGIAQHLTTWGDGKVNINTASREVLLTIPDMDEAMIEAIMEARVGLDGIQGTRDDGIRSLDEIAYELPKGVQNAITIKDIHYVRVFSVGEAQGISAGIWCVLKVEKGTIKPVYWREEKL